MNMKIVGISIGVVIAIVVLAGVLMPVLNEYEEDTTVKYSNVGAKASLVAASTDIDYDGSALTVGGAAFSGGHVAFMSDHAALAYNASKSTLNLYTSSGNYASLTSLDLTADPSTKTLSGTYTTTSVTTPTSLSVTWDDWAVCYDPDGEYVLNYYTSSSVYTPVYYADINDVYAANSVSASKYVAWHGLEVGGTEDGTATLDQKDLTGISDAHYFNTKYNESGLSYVDGDDTYYPPYICAKANVTAMTDTDKQYVGLFSVIPVMLILAVLLGVAFAVMRSRE